jgi:general secretion pathway protein G
MIELLVFILAEFGFIHEEDKHWKKVNQKEKEDGVKRPFQKYFLTPKSLLIIIPMIIISLSIFLFSSYQKIWGLPKETKREIVEISNKLEEWNKKFGQYPTELNELIGNNPLRQDWRNDAWNHPYQFIIAKNGKKFSIISAGSDGKFGTDDDIKSE